LWNEKLTSYSTPVLHFDQTLISEVLSDHFRSRLGMKSSSGSYPMHSTRVIQWCQEHAKAADVLIPVHTSVSVTTTAFLLGKQKNTWVNVLKPGERRQNVSSLGYFPGDHCWLLVTLGHPKPTHSFMESSYSQRQGNESESSV